jgi:hypothetical protein
MDPIAAIIAVIYTPSHHWRKRRPYLEAIKGWRAMGGFMPTVEEVGDVMRRSGLTPKPGWASIARDLGAKG